MRSKLAKLTLAACIALSAFSCSSDDNDQQPNNSGDVSSSSGTGNGGSSSSVGGGQNITYGDPVQYQGETYQTVVIGNQTWFAKNLNVAGGKCYDELPANCTTYGKLYDWATAMGLPESCNTSSCEIQAKHKGICPDDWHIPSDEEWTMLTDYVGGDLTAGTKLKSVSNWNSFDGIPISTDEFGFAALPGGRSNSSGGFSNVEISGFWWNASEKNANDAYSRSMGYIAEYVYRDYLNAKKSLFSVRCIKD